MTWHYVNWVANGDMGTIWYEARELEDEDVAPFTVTDTLTRVLPYCRDGILEIHTNNVRLLWGVCGAPSGAWLVVMSICHDHGVHLRAGEVGRTEGSSPVRTPTLDGAPPQSQRATLT